MKQCIYCLRTEPEATFTKKGEHVIPQSFGKFGSQTPILKCVCSECNQYFGDELDIALSRDSLEAMQRYRHGIRSSEGKRPHSRVTMKLADEEKPEGIPHLRFEMDGSTGKVNVQQMFIIRNKETNEEVSVTRENVDTFDIQPWLKEGMDIEMAGDPEDMRFIFEHLQERGMKFTKDFEYQMLSEVMPFNGRVLLETTGLVDDTIKRALAKILFNFVAHFIGTDIVLSHEWEALREYVREGNGNVPLKTKTGAFWDFETEHIQLEPDGINIRIENKDGNVWGYIQFFNMMIYEVQLAENYQIPDEKLIGGKFGAGEEPVMLKPLRIRSPLYVAQFDVDIRGKPSLKIQGYGGAR